MHRLAIAAALAALAALAAAAAADEVAVRLAADQAHRADSIARLHGCVNAGQIGPLEGVYRFTCPSARAARHLETLAAPGGAGEIEWAEVQVPRRRHTRWSTPRDAMYSREWHLGELRVEPAWRAGVTGAGSVIAVVDDGLDEHHPDLAPHFRAAESWDYNGGDADPAPSPVDSHGTAAAGVAAAARDTLCAVGVAPDAGLVGIRLIARPATDAQEAEALTHRYDTVDIYSNSWGPLDDGQRLEGPGRLAALALRDGVTRGRNGRGAVYVWAGGNGGQAGDNCNYDGYASSRFTVAVGAVDSDGHAAWYSEPCAALLVAAPSSGAARAIPSASPHRRCTATFGGTSAAAPMVAGAVALMLQVRPELTWRDVQHVLVATARRVDADSPGWARNGAGVWMHHRYGAGMVDVAAAVRAAETHRLVAPAASATTGRHWTSEPVLRKTTLELVLDAAAAAAVRRVEHVELTLDIEHPRRGALRITLVSPAGTRAALAEPHRGYGADYRDWTFTSVHTWGEAAAGAWRLEVDDTGPAHAGGLVHAWELAVHGEEAGSN